MAQEEEDVFTAFLCNNKNAFPLTAARQIAAVCAGAAITPLLCGRSGTGKSQLLRAMAAMLSRIWAKTRVMHADAACLYRKSGLGPQAGTALGALPGSFAGRYSDITNETAWQTNSSSVWTLAPGLRYDFRRRRRSANGFACSGRPQTPQSPGRVVCAPSWKAGWWWSQRNRPGRAPALSADHQLQGARPAPHPRPAAFSGPALHSVPFAAGLLLKAEAFATVKDAP